MSLSEELARLANPEPVFKDPEDLEPEDNRAQVVEFENDDQENELVTQSFLRAKNIRILSDVDSRYAGKKVSRKNLHSSEESDIDSQDNSEDEDEISTGDIEENDFDTLKSSSDEKNTYSDHEIDSSNQSEEGKREDASEEEIENDEDDEEEEEEGDDNEQESMSHKKRDTEGSEDDEDNVQTFSKISLDDNVQKGLAVKSQLKLWDMMLECRIKLQKPLMTSNQLPQYDSWSAFYTEGGDKYKTALNQARNSAKVLLDKLTELQTALLLKNPETKTIITQGKGVQTADASDEEIPSNSEDEMGNDDDSNVTDLKRKIKFDDYPNFIQKRRKDFEGYRNATIQKWNDKTRVSSRKLKSFSGFEQSTLKQIEQILSDKDRVIKRTQLKRTPFTTLGKKEPESKIEDSNNDPEMEISPEESRINSHLKDYDPEIFDDSDFYHQMLRELIEKKTADTDASDHATLGRQWLEIQKLRSKMKKKVDTRASKGRRIRYNVHQKLVNYMASYDNSTIREEARNDLYKSLFGR